MPFVKRNTSGGIEAVSDIESEGFTEQLEKNHPELKSFLLRVASSHNAMTETDLDFVRVVEDLVELLIARNYILFTDLPKKAQEKMRKRQALRGKMDTHLDLLSDDEEGFL